MLGKLRNNKLFLSGVILLIIAGNVVYHIFYYDNYKIAENVESVEWLPQSANNISFYMYRDSNIYEFSMEENDFLTWVKDQGLKIKKIESGAVAMARYSFYADLADDEMENLSEEEQYQKWKERTQVSIDNGYIFEGKSDDKINLGSYDLSEKKVYYKSL